MKEYENFTNEISSQNQECKLQKYYNVDQFNYSSYNHPKQVVNYPIKKKKEQSIVYKFTQNIILSHF